MYKSTKNTESSRNEIVIDVSSLNSVQKRLLQQLNSSLLNLMLVQKESYYFQEGQICFNSLMRCMKESVFSKTNKSIPYHQQVLEFAMDNSFESSSDNIPSSIDN